MRLMPLCRCGFTSPTWWLWYLSVVSPTVMVETVDPFRLYKAECIWPRPR